MQEGLKMYKKNFSYTKPYQEKKEDLWTGKHIRFRKETVY